MSIQITRSLVQKAIKAHLLSLGIVLPDSEEIAIAVGSDSHVVDLALAGKEKQQWCFVLPADNKVLPSLRRGDDAFFQGLFEDHGTFITPYLLEEPKIVEENGHRVVGHIIVERTDEDSPRVRTLPTNAKHSNGRPLVQLQAGSASNPKTPQLRPGDRHVAWFEANLNRLKGEIAVYERIVDASKIPAEEQALYLTPEEIKSRSADGRAAAALAYCEL